MKVQAVIPTAGIGQRFKSSQSKPFVLLNGRPVLYYTLKAFEDCELIHSVIVPAHTDSIDEVNQLVETFNIRKVAHVIPGGATRSQSVFAGLQPVDSDTDYVVIHDGVRPLVSAELISRAVEACDKVDAVTVAVPVKPTIKQVNPDSSLVERTLDRSTLWEIQTPQVFKRDVILQAHQQDNTDNMTDDASGVERMGLPVKVVSGDYRNIKITTQEDLVVAEAFLKQVQEVQ